MFHSVGTFLPSLFPLANILQMFAGEKEEDEADDDDSDLDNGDAEEQGDEEEPEEEDDQEKDEGDDSDEEEPADDDLEEELDPEEKTRRNADSVISKTNEQRDASINTLVKVMVKYPESAESTIDDLRKEQPELAARLAKMFESQSNKSLNEALKDAPENVRSVLSKLVEDVGTLKESKQQEQIREERRIYKDWERAKHPYLSPKNEIAKTPLGKKLVTEFQAAINRMPDSEPMTEDLLEDALAIAKRRTGWKNSRVSEQAKQQAKEQALKARSGAAGTGKGSKGKQDEENPKPSRITSLFPNQSPDRQKRVDEAKKAKGLK